MWSDVTLSKAVSVEKPGDVVESTPLKNHTTAIGKQLAVGNMARTSVAFK